MFLKWRNQFVHLSITFRIIPVNYINFNLTEERQILSLFIKSLIDFRKIIKFLKADNMLKIWNFYGHLARPFPDFSPFWTLTDMNFVSFASNNEEESIFVAINKGNNNVKFILPKKHLRKIKITILFLIQKIMSLIRTSSSYKRLWSLSICFKVFAISASARDNPFSTNWSFSSKKGEKLVP